MDDADAEAGNSRKPLTHSVTVRADARSDKGHDAAAVTAAGSSNAGSRHGAANNSSHSATTSELNRESFMPLQSTLATSQAEKDRTHRKRKDRPKSSFLLDSWGIKHSSHSSRFSKPKPGPKSEPPTSTHTHFSSATNSSTNTPESLRSAALRDSTMRIPSGPLVGGLPALTTAEAKNSSTGSLGRSSSAYSQNSNSTGRTVVDVDCAQIVNMALSLSESRRLASRRSISRSDPPKLLPLSESAATNGLRQQLRQQRRSSRNISPRPRLSMNSRQSTGLPASSSLPSNFYAGQSESYGYHFSPSTLARAQKAKDQLELMAQYRKLLDFLPPLKPVNPRTVTTSPPGSPVGGMKVFAWNSTAHPQQLGRKFNPLQYIRNKKVRARERKIIDGEKQGFGEVDNVKAWVEQCEKNVALQQPNDDARCIVPYQGAEESATQSLPDSASKAARSRRPRVDWFVEPCDMLADAYWTEQDQNKELVEDRLWRRIFPPKSEGQSSMPRETDETRQGIVPYAPDISNQFLDNRNVSQPQKQHSLDHGSHNPIERAREKLHNIKDPHHWQISDHLPGRPRSKKESASEYSESDAEARNRIIRDNRNRSDTTPAQPDDILHRQMLEMIAAENRDKDILEFSGVERFVPPSMNSPDKMVRSKAASRLHSRRNSLLDGSDNERKSQMEKVQKKTSPRFRLGQQNPEDRGLGAPRSVENDSSLPTSPEILPSRKLTMESVTLELPPSWSRPGSPIKYPSTRSQMSPERQDITGKGKRAVLSDSGLSPTRNASAPLANDAIKGHRRMGSLRQRAEDGSSGLRNIFNRPRIDTVLRGGVSRIGDILRKKNGTGESQEADTADESDSERARGRQQPSKKDSHKTQEPKHFLDVMPQFKNAPGSPTDDHIRKSFSWAGRDVQSNNISRTDPLNHSHGVLRSPSMPAPSPPKDTARLGESDISEPDSIPGRALTGVSKTDGRPNTMRGDATIRGADGKQRTVSRQWSIVDQEGGPAAKQNGQLSRREMARIKTLVLSSGIKAMEINRRAKEMQRPFDSSCMDKTCAKLMGIDWGAIVQVCVENKGQQQQQQLSGEEVLLADVYPLAAQVLGRTIEGSCRGWKGSVEKLRSVTGPELERRIGAVRSAGEEVAQLARGAADEADETSRGLAIDQPLRVKQAVDTIEAMLRQRRRRLRWLRRGLWLSVEWLVVGFMWCVWFVVMVLRVCIGVGEGVWRGVKWILWLS